MLFLASSDFKLAIREHPTVVASAGALAGKLYYSARSPNLAAQQQLTACTDAASPECRHSSLLATMCYEQHGRQSEPSSSSTFHHTWHLQERWAYLFPNLSTAFSMNVRCLLHNSLKSCRKSLEELFPQQSCCASLQAWWEECKS